MPAYERVEALFVGDPVLWYSLLGALFLLAVSAAAGLVRQDFRALLRPGVAIAAVLAVMAALLLSLLIHGEPAPLHDEGSGLLAGFERLPLYLFALAYGPLPAAATALLYGLLGPVGMQDYASAGVLLMELVLLGWLAIYPSPRQYRWAGPVNAILGYALAWATAGVAYVQWRSGDLRAHNLLSAHPGEWSGIALIALCLFAVGPGLYAQLLPHSRIDPHYEERQTLLEPLGEPPAARRAGRRSRSRSRSLEAPDVPPLLRGQGRSGRRRRGRLEEAE